MAGRLLSVSAREWPVDLTIQTDIREMTFDDFPIEDGTQRLGIGPVAIAKAGWWHVRLGIHRAKREVWGMEYTPESNDLTEPSGVARFLAASLAAAEMVLVLLLLGYSV